MLAYASPTTGIEATSVNLPNVTESERGEELRSRIKSGLEVAELSRR
jgi:hypothetical protein